MKIKFYCDVYPYHYKPSQTEYLSACQNPTWPIGSDGKRYSFVVDIPELDYKAVPIQSSEVVEEKGK